MTARGPADGPPLDVPPDVPPDVMVAVGTDHHPFDRMVRWVDEWAASHPSKSIFVQTGTSHPARVAASAPYLDFEVMAAALRDATVVVSHGGAATMIEVRRAGHLPIVVARDPSLGEHVDDHQMRHCEMLAERGEIVLARSAEDLAAVIDNALARPQDFTIDPAAGTAVDVVMAFGHHIEQLVRERRP